MVETKNIEFEVKHNLLLVDIRHSYKKMPLYEATREGWWGLSKAKLVKVNYVLGIYEGVVVSIYKPDCWKRLNKNKKRWRFYDDDQDVSQDIQNIYCRKRVPPKYLGARRPTRYAWLEE